MPKSSQENNSASPKFIGFFDRITEVLGTTKTGEIAAKLGLAPSSVSEWKHTGKPPSIENLLRIADLGNTSVEYLLVGHHPRVYLTKEKKDPSEAEEFVSSPFYKLYIASKKAEPDDLRFIEDFIQISLRRLEEKPERQGRIKEKSRPKGGSL